MNVALLGAGGIGEAHSTAYTFIPEAQVRAVIDIRHDRAVQVAQKHGANVYTSIQEALENEALDMVDICTPTFTHKDLAVTCLENDLHVLIEKPIAMTLEDARLMVEAAASRRRKFMVAQVIRFWSEYVYLKQACERNDYGRLLEVSFSRTSGAPLWAWQGWYVDAQRSGRAPFELGIHDIDFVNYLLGKPERVSAHNIEVPERYFSSLRATFDFPGGLTASTEAAWYPGTVPFSAVYRAVFEEAVLDYSGDGLLLYAAGQDQPQVISVEQEISISTSINLKGAGPIYNEIAYFVDCLVNDRFPQVLTPQDSLLSLEMLETALRSSHMGKPISF
jgi:predicted dehydrogenase